MKVELLGGPKCGEVVEIPYVDSVISLWDTDGNVVKYQRRDRPFTLDGGSADCHSSGGYRLYDYVKNAMPKS